MENTNIEKYNNYLIRYRKLLQQVRNLDSRAGVNIRLKNKLLVLDAKRDALHIEMKKFAASIGKTSEDVDLDILLGDNGLKEFKMPEFKISKIQSLLENIRKATISELEYDTDNEDFSKKQKLEKDFYQDYLFIPFIEEQSWHLYKEEPSFDIMPDGLEKRRRLNYLKEKFPEIVVAEIFLPETFHRKTRIYGAIFHKKQFERLVHFLVENRSKVSIDKENFNKEILFEDWKKILKLKIKEILNCKLNEGESYSNLLKRFKENINYLDLSDEYKNIAHKILDDEIEMERVNREVNQELKGYGDYPEYENLPKRESFSRK